MARGILQNNNKIIKHPGPNIYASVNHNQREKIKSIGRQTTMGSTILSTSPQQRRIMKQSGNPWWHQQRNKSKRASELMRLRIRINRWLESRNYEIIKENKFRRPAKIRVKTNMTSAKKYNGHMENKIKLQRKDSDFQSHNGESWNPKDLQIKNDGDRKRIKQL